MSLSNSAKYIATLNRVAVTDPKVFNHLIKGLYPNATRRQSLALEIDIHSVEGVEDAVGVWHHEHQMGYVVLP